jgi:hypothetical protein
VISPAVLKTKVPFAMLILMAVSFVLILYSNSSNLQKTVNDQERVKAQVLRAVRSYHALGIDFEKNLIEYKPFGSFLHFEDTAYFIKPNFRSDLQGIPQVKYGSDFFYNPVTVAQYALYLYGKYLRDQTDIHKFIAAVDKLLSLQAKNGAFEFSFAWHYYLIGKSFQPRWVSAMAQGQALSALARAYALTKEPRYLEAGNKAFNFLLIPVSMGGVMDTLTDLNPNWNRYIIFEQYPVEPASYTLNGFMFTLLGCYDWWQLDPGGAEGSSKIAVEAFAAGMKTLDTILKYYDIGGFATYDLGYITHQARPVLDPFYFAVDIYLLHALYSITGDETLKEYERLWTSYLARAED